MPYNFLVRANRAKEEMDRLLKEFVPLWQRQWFAGFTDAEGCLGIYPSQSGKLHFSVGQRDINTLICLRNLLTSWHIALFQIKEKPNLNKAAFSALTVPELRTHVTETCMRLFTLLNGQLNHPEKISVLISWGVYLKQEVKSSLITWPWLAGFFEGDGSIYLDHKSITIGISQKNKELLQKIQNFLGFGCIHNIQNNCFSFKCHGKNVFTVLKNIFPYIQFKQTKDKILLIMKGGETINGIVRDKERHIEVILYENLNIGGSPMGQSPKRQDLVSARESDKGVFSNKDYDALRTSVNS